MSLQVSDRRTLTRSVIQHSDVRLLLGQHSEHHVPGGLPGAVQDPGGEGLERAQRADVDHRAPQAEAARKRLQDARRQAESAAHVERQVPVDLRRVRERLSEAGDVAQRGWRERRRSQSHV